MFFYIFFSVVSLLFGDLGYNCCFLLFHKKLGYLVEVIQQICLI